MPRRYVVMRASLGWTMTTGEAFGGTRLRLRKRAMAFDTFRAHDGAALDAQNPDAPNLDAPKLDVTGLPSSGARAAPLAQAEISESREVHLATIVRHSRDAIWSWNTDGLITQWNPAAERLLGYPPEQIIGKSILTLVPQEREARAQHAIQKLQQGIPFEQHETVRVHRDGTPIEVEITVTPVMTVEGRLVGATTVCRDVRERKQVAASLARRLQELTTLHELTERLQAAASLPEIYEAALQAILNAL
jgi:PAS domain S-box-containing protein